MVPGPGGAQVRINGLALGVTPIAGDGQIAFTAGFDNPGGGTAQGAFLTAKVTDEPTDLVLMQVGTPQLVNDEGKFSVVIQIENRGPAAANEQTLTAIAASGVWDMDSCSVVDQLTAYCSCVGAECINAHLYPGEKRMLTIGGTLSVDKTTVTFEVFTDQELNPADNVLEVMFGATEDGEDGGWCASGGGSPTLLVGLSLVGLVLRRRRR
jgi:hypothetical protein